MLGVILDTDSEHCDINDAYGTDGHFNIFYADEVTSHAVSWPWDTVDTDFECRKNMIVHKQDDAGWGWTVAHEFGHWCGLYHTFQSGENVTRNSSDGCFNCNTEGDELCDTPADYGTHWCDSDDDECECTGDYGDPDCTNGGFTNQNTTHFDACGVLYSPPGMNLMAYGCRPCAHQLTQGQVDRLWVFLTSRLHNSVVHVPCPNNINLTGVINKGQRIETNTSITTNESVNTHQWTLYDAGNEIILTDGFRARAFNVGSTTVYPNVKFVIEGCYGEHQLSTPESQGMNRTTTQTEPDNVSGN